DLERARIRIDGALADARPRFDREGRHRRHDPEVRDAPCLKGGQYDGAVMRDAGHAYVAAAIVSVVDPPRVRVEVLVEVRSARNRIGGVRTGRAGRIEKAPVAVPIDDRGVAQERDVDRIARWIRPLGTRPDVAAAVGSRVAIQAAAAIALRPAPGAAGVDAGHGVLERSAPARTPGSRLLLADAAVAGELDLPFLDLQHGPEGIHGGPVLEPPRDPVVQARVEPGVVVLHPTRAAKA